MSDIESPHLRAEVLKLAREMLEQEYYARRESMRMKWEDVTSQKLSGSHLPISPPPKDPPYPTEEEVIMKAKSLNRTMDRKV